MRLSNHAPRWHSALLAAAGVALTASCGLGAAVHAAEIPQEQLAGTWTSPEGTSLAFSAEHTFTGTGLDKVEALAHCGRPEAPSTGRWAFVDRSEGRDLPGPDETAVRGSTLRLTFTGDPACEASVFLYGDFGDTTDPVMCPTLDADAGCPSGDYLKRDQPFARP
ncbi:hypothetical protein [Streptomyces sp. NPDC058157]|uniref:hypothetical protein n=1 Tax=Streptomyces sp. NPDC058157 TaxID=3346360 RepID=UPI0036E24F98